MNRAFKLLAVLAHPDDESLGFGGTFAKYAAEGIATYLVTATRGERGRFGARGERGDPAEVGRVPIIDRFIHKSLDCITPGSSIHDPG